MANWITSLFGSRNQRLVAGYSRLVARVNDLEPAFQSLTDAQLRDKTSEFRQRIVSGVELDALLPEAFAAVREASRRTLGLRHFDVQLIGGMTLHEGKIAEMRTGEGKTLVSTLPAYLNALSGRGVHVVTVNDYLAQRDSEWMGRVHRFLGLEVGCIRSQMPVEERRAAYNADITYGTNNEFGFDYLRDNMAWSADDLVQRGHNFAIVDEVDSILIDEARTPLIISGPADEPSELYGRFSGFAQRLVREDDYEVEEKKRTVGILESGVAKIEEWMQIDNLYEPVNTPLVGFLNNALKAKELFKLDRDYVVMDGEVLIVDEHTGRILPGRRYSEGMHQAIEAKESVPVLRENQTLATITLQNFFRLYDRLSGMTGTAMTEAAEFLQIYKLGVVPIPTNRPMVRDDRADLIYRTEAAKYTAVVDDIVARHEKGQPVLVGTTSVEKSEDLSKMLRRRGVPHEVLNAKFHEREASIVAQAGRKGAVTVATNMAGRGTDIMLGGNAEAMATAELEQQGLDPIETAEAFQDAWPAALAKAESRVLTEREEVRELGGLYVVGTERHESRRIDNQLRGRSGRQGDPGESRFYLSLEDDLLRLFNAAAIDSFLVRFNVPDDVPIEARMVTNAIRSAQTQVESQNFQIRKDILKYDEVMNRQRLVIYAERRKVLDGADLRDQVVGFVEDTLDGYVLAATAEGYAEEWDLETLWTAFAGVYPVSVTLEELLTQGGGDLTSLDPEFLAAEIKQDADRAYRVREEEIGPEIMREVERRVVLSVLDQKWREHLYEMDYLREGIGLRALAQRDPVVEYQREGYDLFTAMMESIKEESAALVFQVDVTVEDAEPLAGAPESSTALSADAVITPGLTEPRQPAAVYYSAPDLSGGGAAVQSAGSVGPIIDPEFGAVSKNALCPCGSGRKYKRCHGDPKGRPGA